MQQVDLSRYEALGVVGTGADYEVRAAMDRETGKRVVLKRPQPQTIRHLLHSNIETRTERILEAYQIVGHTLPMVVPILGYTERTNHDAYFGDALGQEYRVMVEERASGIPLVGDIKARFTGVPIGVGQNLFALFPLSQPEAVQPFAIHTQLLDLEEAFVQAGYLLLDLRPHNVFYQPATGRITVIDYGALSPAQQGTNRRGKPLPEVHDFYLEMLKFYTTAQLPPRQAGGYKDPYGLRPVVNFTQELEQMARQAREVPEPRLQEAALTIIGTMRQRAYPVFADFRRDLMAYLQVIYEAQQASPHLGEMQQAWREALQWLHADYWQRYLFAPATELAAFSQ